MKRLLFLWVVMLLLVGPAVLGAGAQPDFRSVRWGMSMDEVVQREKLPVVYRDKDMLSYKTSMAGVECDLMYLFHDQALISASYTFTEFHTKAEEYLKDYDKVTKEICKEYGESRHYVAGIKEDKKHKRSKQWGEAENPGKLYLETTWRTERTMICLVLKNTYGMRFMATYSSMDFVEKPFLEGVMEEPEGDGE